MNFAWPDLLWLLFAPAALLGWEITHRRRAAAAAHPKILRAEAGAHSLQFSAPNSPLPPRRARPRGWLALGLALAIVALARPQYGRLEEPVFDQSREILLAIDLSRSMLAPDVKPSRLERSKLLIQSLLEKLSGERVGLVVFSGTAFLQSPLSSDYEILREFLPALGPDFLPAGGTNYRALVDTSLTAFGSSAAADRFLIVLSDGEATDDDWKSGIEDLKKKGIRVIGLGVGTAAGAMIPDGKDGFMKDERGAVVLSKLESGTLQQLASVTGGVYRDASTWLDLATLLKETVEAGRKGRFLEKNTVRLAERFQWPLAFGLWCLLMSLCYEFPVRPRPRAITLKIADRRLPIAPAGTTAAALIVLLFVIGTPPSAIANEPSPSSAAGLSKIVGRLSATEARSARDWAELGRETVTWGSHLQSEQQPVLEGPVRDALAAVDTGSALDPKTADWPKLREELEALLKKPDDKKDDQKSQDKDQQNQDQKDQEQKNQDQKNQDQQKSDQQKQQDQKSSDQKPQDQNQSQDKKPDEAQKKPGESAFGDMQQKDQPPPPPPSGTQKVGGEPEQKDRVKEPVDPTLALPLQKLEQLRNQDSPAQLFQLMDGDKKPTEKKKGKDW
ncbi:MAG: VWA domain-containing protein [Opitutus sp.]|nr:VWA domain-containing protein [Opitutus sp.]